MIDNDLQLVRHALTLDLRRANGGYYFVGGPMMKPVDLPVAEALARLESALPAPIVPYVRRSGGIWPSVPTAS